MRGSVRRPKDLPIPSSPSSTLLDRLKVDTLVSRIYTRRRLLLHRSLAVSSWLPIRIWRNNAGGPARRNRQVRGFNPA